MVKKSLPFIIITGYAILFNLYLVQFKNPSMPYKHLAAWKETMNLTFVCFIVGLAIKGYKKNLLVKNLTWIAIGCYAINSLLIVGYHLNIFHLDKRELFAYNSYVFITMIAAAYNARKKGFFKRKTA